MLEWISTKDRMPTKDGLYIVVACRGDYRYVRPFSYESKADRWWFLGEPVVGYDVTHWMNLPKAPEEG